MTTSIRRHDYERVFFDKTKIVKKRREFCMRIYGIIVLKKAQPRHQKGTDPVKHDLDPLKTAICL